MIYSIKEVSEKLNIPASTIRYYEKRGLINYIKRTEGGIRKFDDKDVEWIYYITCFLKTGMKIDDLKNIVELAMEGESTINERREILERHREELKQRQRDLDLATKALNHKLENYTDRVEKIKIQEK